MLITCVIARIYAAYWLIFYIFFRSLDIFMNRDNKLVNKNVTIGPTRT